MTVIVQSPSKTNSCSFSNERSTILLESISNWNEIEQTVSRNCPSVRELSLESVKNCKGYWNETHRLRFERKSTISDVIGPHTCRENRIAVLEGQLIRGERKPGQKRQMGGWQVQTGWAPEVRSNGTEGGFPTGWRLVLGKHWGQLADKWDAEWTGKWLRQSYHFQKQGKIWYEKL